MQSLSQQGRAGPTILLLIKPELARHRIARFLRKARSICAHKNNYFTEVRKMSAASLYPVRPEVLANTLTDEATYKAMYQQSVVNPDGF